MESRYQYSSLFTSGLLMMPRPGFVVGSVENTSEMENHPSVSRRMSCNLTMPIVVNIPGTMPTQRRTTRRRPSSLLLNLSPQSARSSPVQTAEDSWDRIKCIGGSSSPVSEMRMPTQPSNRLVPLATTSEQVETSESHECKYMTFTNAAAATRGQEVSITYTSTRKPVSPKPKPAPTSPLPELPNARTRAHSSSERTPFGAIQA